MSRTEPEMDFMSAEQLIAVKTRSLIFPTLLHLGLFAAEPALASPPVQSDLVSSTTPKEQANYGFVTEWWRVVLQGGRFDRAREYQADDYIQHTPNVPTGLDPTLEFFKNVLKIEPAESIPKTMKPAPDLAGAKGDFVFLMFKHAASLPDNPAQQYTFYTFELLRIENNKNSRALGQLQTYSLACRHSTPASEMGRC